MVTRARARASLKKENAAKAKGKAKTKSMKAVKAMKKSMKAVKATKAKTKSMKAMKATKAKTEPKAKRAERKCGRGMNRGHAEQAVKKVTRKMQGKKITFQTEKNIILDDEFERVVIGKQGPKNLIGVYEILSDNARILVDKDPKFGVRFSGNFQRPGLVL